MGSQKWEVGSVRIFLLLIVLIVININCNQENNIEPAFYYWKTEFSLSNSEQHYIDSLQVHKIYVKFFDVDWDETRQLPIPQAESTIANFRPPTSDFRLANIIPCVFITNRTFQNMTDDKIDWLAERVKEKLFTLKPANSTFQEIQFDCDWTASTRERFFTFLQLFTKKLNNPFILISATIRLHQYRDFKETGVPPVNRGMLMFYNTGDVENWAEENSILNLEAAGYYLPTSNFRLPASKTYPIPLDIALPIFSWGVLFRNGSMIRLINNLQATDLTDTSRFLKITDNRFEVQKSSYLNGYYLYQGDQIRTESIDKQLLSQATDLLKNNIKKHDLTVAFYHLDTATIKHFPHEFLEKIIHQFQ